MAKKMDRGEPKKECPSCGLGVSLEANICEFCGWDFEEEDEWILQIEKLERELMLEKQRFEPGTVNHKIEATLRSPVLERAEAAQTAAHTPAETEEEEQVPAYTAIDLIERRAPPAKRPLEASGPEHARPEAPQVPVTTVSEEAAAPKTRKVRSVKAPAPAPQPVHAHEPKHEHPRAEPERPTRPQVRTVKKQEPAAAAPEKKVRTVRKVKG